MRKRWTLLAAMTALAILAASAPASAPAPTLQLISEPAAGDAPFLAMIDHAERSVTLTIYELTDPAIERALGQAAARGVNVRVLLNGGYYSEPEETNAAAYHYLGSHRVHVRYTPAYFALTHQKTVTVDGREAAIMTLNFDGLYASTRDFAIVDRQPQDVGAIVATFDADWAGDRISPSSGTGDLLWSPGAQGRTLALIDSARHSLELENEEMDYAPATTALCDAARRGVAVKIVMTYESEWRSAFAELQSCGARIHLFHGQSYYIHAKLLLVDGRAALVGSQNLSTTSLERNRELGIELHAHAVLGQLAAAFNRDFSGAP